MRVESRKVDQARRARARTKSAAGIQSLGSILGTAHLPDDIVRHSAELAEEFFSAAEENEFCGDPVETYVIPRWASRGGATWLPNLTELGYHRAEGGYRGREQLLVVTAGVDMHTDDEGLVLMVVLHNDGLTFRQGLRGWPVKPGTAGMASSVGSNAIESCRLAPVTLTASGVPRASTTMCRFDPSFPGSVGLGAILAPPTSHGAQRADARRILPAIQPSAYGRRLQKRRRLALSSVQKTQAVQPRSSSLSHKRKLAAGWLQETPRVT
ncbi:hypothetical protein BamMEX5DRAFT_2240 [Burkholderia ambifaria MEX-5]|uniref:Uncharacterized protein n=1 Tax=Burkholderia ambifaria MEX-5 TaxID=396597 RepID=B1T374_9BURK|nr:hypothetical protein BamMEX5DRAFT_2240 [Burkholderia ambifaria MEX-5]